MELNLLRTIKKIFFKKKEYIRNFSIFETSKKKLKGDNQSSPLVGVSERPCRNADIFCLLMMFIL